MRNLTLFVLCWLIIGTTALAQQDLSTSSNRAKRKFNDALQHYRNNELSPAIEQANQAVSIDPDFTQVHLLLAELNHETENYTREIHHYQRVLELEPERYGFTRFFLAEAYLKLGQYTQARTHYKAFQPLLKKYQSFQEVLPRRIAQCEFAKEQQAHPVDFHPKNLGQAVNSRHPDYSPSLTADEAMLIITRRIQATEHVSHFRQGEQEDFFVSYAQDSIWQPAENLRSLNTPLNEGAQSISADGRVMVFTACHRPDGKGSCDLYIAYHQGKNWTKPQNMGYPVNTSGWESQPSLSADGRELFYVSNRGGTRGETDIWVTHQQADGQWANPQNLGDSINTKGSELTPFIHTDGTTLYFSSNEWLGMGSYDLFLSRRTGANSWSHPKNLGYPINTHGEESGLIINARGNRAYYAAQHDDTFGDLDIYQFNLPKPLRPNASTFFKGIVYDAQTKERLQARFELINLQNQALVAQSASSAANGSFLLSLPVNQRYALNVSRPGYLFYSENFDLTGQHSADNPFLKNIPLQPIKQGQTVILENIFFELDKYALKKESLAELKKLKAFLARHPNVHVEIRGHTDNQGTASYNTTLSNNRARVVYEWLIEQGIAKERLAYKGYGYEEPIADNATEKGRARNRRTEFKILQVD